MPCAPASRMAPSIRIDGCRWVLPVWRHAVPMSILLDLLRRWSASTPSISLTFSILLLATLPCSASVTVLPEATPTPAPKHGKEKKHPSHPDEPTHQPENGSSESAKSFSGVWRGATDGRLAIPGNQPHPNSVNCQFVFGNDGRSISMRNLALGPPRNLTDVRQIDARTMKAEIVNRTWLIHLGNFVSTDRYTFRLESPTSLRVEEKEVGKDGFVWAEREGVLNR